MVEKLIIPEPNVIDFARYRKSRNAAGKVLAMSARICRHCAAALSDGENEDDCSTVLATEAPRLRERPRKFRAD